MSRLCQEKEKKALTGVCNHPAMTRFNDRWVCYSCLDRLEEEEKRKQERRRHDKNPTRR